MNHYIVWHDNGDKARTAENCGYSEEFSDLTAEEIRKDYENSGCRVFSIDKVQ